MKLSLRLPPLKQLFAGAGAIRLPRREVLLVAAAGFLAGVVTLIVLIVSFNAQEARAARPPAGPTAGSGSPAVEDGLSVDDLMLPSLHASEAGPQYYPFRPRLSRWTKENVERFWVSPRQIVIDAIGAMNDKNLENLLEKVK